jgi:hypothetical protein
MMVMMVLLLVGGDVRRRMVMIFFENLDHVVDEKAKIYLDVLEDLNHRLLDIVCEVEEKYHVV